ncbi:MULTISPECIES: Gp19/Gp15/Gp42 family protein [unclassified Dietzia]|uniref:Gp19/Gp15/Gp42 family protein n=1 Tax=unclassified Dietzia TaxID=2617939 RepID=UPI002814D2D7|nr:Gp19/Gp15/Gp42 family protein [Dietzia sp. DQ12-76]
MSELQIGVTAEEVALRIPRPLDEDELDLLELLIADAEGEIADALAVAGRDLALDLARRPGFAGTARRVMREMVAAVVLVGGNAGQASVTSSTGAQSDSVRFADTRSSRWGQVVLTDDQRARLGLAPVGLPRGRFPKSRVGRWV